VWLKFVSSRSAARAAAIALAWFAFAWAVVRACVQAVTGDEAQDYLFYAGPFKPTHWDAAANNHLLNSIGSRLFASIFGLSALAVRIPTLMGAAIYIYTMYWLCQKISPQWRVRIPVFVCLVYNPFIFDFFVAARGYGIANAFLMGAIAVSAAWHLDQTRPVGEENDRLGVRELMGATAISSAFLALAFSANFSLAFAGFTAMALILIWAIKAAPGQWWKLLTAAAVPGLLVVLFLPSWTLLHFRQAEVVAGVKSLKETLFSLLDASMFEPNPHLINPLLLPVFVQLRDYLLPVTGVLALVQLVWIAKDRVWRRSPHTAWLCALGSLVGGVAVLAVLEHRLAYRLFRLLMPVSRTGLFLLPLVTLLVGIAAAIPAFSRGAAVCRTALIGALSVMGVYYLFCLRLTYFQEWDYQADLNQAYKVVACYNHEKDVRDVEVSWYYHAGMNFLRTASGHETFGPFSSTTPHTTGHEMYVLEGNFERDFIDAQGLKVVFKGDRTAMVVAVRPDLAEEQGGACYVWPAYP
jgi:hypothetical protein